MVETLQFRVSLGKTLPQQAKSAMGGKKLESIQFDLRSVEKLVVSRKFVY